MSDGDRTAPPDQEPEAQRERAQLYAGSFDGPFRLAITRRRILLLIVAPVVFGGVAIGLQAANQRTTYADALTRLPVLLDAAPHGTEIRTSAYVLPDAQLADQGGVPVEFASEPACDLALSGEVQALAGLQVRAADGDAWQTPPLTAAEAEPLCWADPEQPLLLRMTAPSPTP